MGSSLLRLRQKIASFHQRMFTHLAPRLEIKVGNRNLVLPSKHKEFMALTYRQETWTKKLYEALLRRGPNPVFIDAGVNVGQSLLDMLETGIEAEYWGFEPNPYCVCLVDQLIQQNHLKKTQLVCTALSDTFGLAKLLYYPGSDVDTSASLVESLRGQEGFHLRPVPLVPFDEVWSAAPGSCTLTIKIDVEGAERKVLQGMAKTLALHRPLIVVEVLYADSKEKPETYLAEKQALQAFIEEGGYFIARVLKTEVGTFQGLSELKAFPYTLWNAANAHECDYLLVPKEERALFETLRGPKKGN